VPLRATLTALGHPDPMLLVWVLLAALNMGASGGAPAERGPAIQVTPTDPPEVTFSSDSENGRCVGAEGLLSAHSPGWSVARMSRIMYRESRCIPTVRSGAGAVGLLQVMTSNCPYLAEQMGETCTATKLRDPNFNIRAARSLFLYDGYTPWST